MQKLLLVKAYFVTRSVKTFTAYSNFFLIGGRKNFAVLSLLSLVDQLKRLTVFLKLCAHKGVELWTISSDCRKKRFLWWIATSLRFPFIFKTRNLNGFFLCKWRGRCFLGNWRDMGLKVRNFIGVDAILMIGFTDFDDEVFGFFLHQRNAVTLYIAEPDINSKAASFPFYCAVSRPTLVVYYCRVACALLRGF